MKKRNNNILLKLLVFLSPDATDTGHLAMYLYGKDTYRSNAATRVCLSRLRAKGWVIGKKGSTLDELQYVYVQGAYERYGKFVGKTDITPTMLAKLATEN